MTTCPPKIAFYTIGDENYPSTRFRICQYLPEFRKAGISVDLFGLTPAGENRIQALFGFLRQGCVRRNQLRKLSGYDLVIVQKGLTPWRCRGLVEQLNASGVPYLLDIDDAVYSMTPIRLFWPAHLLQDDGEPLKLIRGAREVITGNRFLAESIQKYNSAVSVIPTSIDTDKYQVPARSPEKEPVVGWSGSLGTNAYFNSIIPALNALARKFKFSVLIISSSLKGIETEKFRGLKWNFLPWRRETEVEDLQKIDIGLMSLEDNEWNRGKCGLKALLYMSVGAPSVSSPVGVSLEMIEDGVNGFLADGEDEWIQKLALLLENPTLRQAMGLRARKTVEARYSLKVNFPRFQEVIENAASPHAIMAPHTERLP